MCSCHKSECKYIEKLSIFAIPYLIRDVINEEIMKYILTAIGLLALGLGILGIFLPVLPTTPFLLLASALFLKSSRPLYDWLMEHPKLGPYIKNFMIHKSIPLKVKVISVSLVWITLLNCTLFVAEHWAFRLFFVALAAVITAHILSYKTMK